MDNINELLDELENGCDDSAIISLLLEVKKENQYLLFRRADSIRKIVAGDDVHFRGIIEFSNYCFRNCHYCGLRKDNTKLVRYRMTLSEIEDTITRASIAGFKTIVLQSGEDPEISIADIENLVHFVKKKGMAVTLSIGERARRDYQIWREAGADRYLLKIESSVPRIFKSIHPDDDLNNRIRCIEDLIELGYQTGSGNIIGLPGQRVEDIAEDIRFFKRYGFDMIGIGPFLPHKETPLSRVPKGSFDLTLKTIAIIRILMKFPHLPGTTAIGTLKSGGREIALSCGANVIMPDITPVKYKPLYDIYPDRICRDEEGKKCLSCMEIPILKMGRKIAIDHGDSLKNSLNDLIKEKRV